MDKKNERDKYNMYVNENDSVALTTELTGLLQTPPESPAEAIAYTELASIPVPKAKKEKDGKQYKM